MLPHNCPVAHWLELELTKALWQKDSSGLVLGAEMFERDNQQQVDDYVARRIGSDELVEQARVWDNFWTDYEPLIFGSFPEICGDECSAEVCGLCEG